MFERVLLESVFSLLYGTETLVHIFCTELTQKTQVKKKRKQQMLPRVI